MPRSALTTRHSECRLLRLCRWLLTLFTAATVLPPETMQHPEVRSECSRLAYLIQAFGLASTKPVPPHVKYAVSPRHCDTSQHQCRMGRSDRTRELAEAL